MAFVLANCRFCFGFATWAFDLSPARARAAEGAGEESFRAFEQLALPGLACLLRYLPRCRASSRVVDTAGAASSGLEPRSDIWEGKVFFQISIGKFQSTRIANKS